MEQLNSIVDFEIAKLLKEKGFDNDDCQNIYYCDFEEGFELDELQVSDRMLKEPEVEEFDYLAPKISTVIDWIYNKHGVWILVDWMTRIKPYNSGFYSHLRGTNKPLNQDNFISINNTKSPGYEVFNSPKEAYIEAIKYVLTKMI